MRLETIEESNRRFALPGTAEIVEGNGRLAKLKITTPEATGEMYLHGAQVASWRPAGAEEVLFLSSHSKWEDGSAIRGGIPICFPWFRAKADNPKAPAHGFVRTKAWKLDSVTKDGDTVTVSMSTGNDEDTTKWWPSDFRLVHRVTFGRDLKLNLAVTNTGTTPLYFEEALHTYHKVGQIDNIRVQGLDGVPYLDNTDANREKTQHGDVVITTQTDSAYVNTQHPLELVDPELHRRIRITKENSLTTVVWNPWSQGAQSLSDLGDDEWQQFVCVEASNILGCAVKLEPRQQHSIRATIGVAQSIG
jgi:glucose-6-phosphate 1-epimerase